MDSADTTRTEGRDDVPARRRSVCPWWVGYLLLCPLRRVFEDPETILGPHVRPGMTVLDPGCAMGYFSLPLARMVGPQGRVICVDLQERMINRLGRRARKAGLSDRIEASICKANDLGISEWRGRVDLVAAIHVIHEVPDQSAFLTQLHGLLRSGGRLLILEPKGHVTDEEFSGTLERAREAGFIELPPTRLRRDHAALMENPTDQSRDL